MVKRSLARRWTYYISKTGLRILGVLFYRIRCRGREHFPEKGGALVCANHQSYLDPMLVGLSCNRPMNYLARETLFRIPIFGPLIHCYNAIPLQREGIGIGGIKETLRRLRDGELVLIFPEGTRSSDGQVAPLQPGFCALARRGRAPLLPVGIEGAFQSWPRGRILPARTKIQIVVGEPITTDQIKEWADEQLVEELQQRIVSCHRQARLFICQN